MHVREFAQVSWPSSNKLGPLYRVGVLRLLPRNLLYLIADLVPEIFFVVLKRFLEGGIY